MHNLDAAVAFYRRAGAVVTDPEEWRSRRSRRGLLARALFSDDLDGEIEGHDIAWGPAVVSGPTFGTRRIASVNAPGRMRLEFMEQVEEP